MVEINSDQIEGAVNFTNTLYRQRSRGVNDLGQWKTLERSLDVESFSKDPQTGQQLLSTIKSSIEKSLQLKEPLAQERMLLSKKHKEVLYWHFGIEDGKRKTFEEIAGEIGRSKTLAYKLVQQAILRLRWQDEALQNDSPLKELKALFMEYSTVKPI